MKRIPTKSRKPSPIEAFLALSDEEKEAVYRSVDREIPLSETRPLTPAQRRIWERAKRKGRGRPKVGGGAKRVPVSIERGLLHRIDEYAKAKGLSRSQLIARGAEMVLRAS